MKVKERKWVKKKITTIISFLFLNHHSLTSTYGQGTRGEGLSPAWTSNSGDEYIPAVSIVPSLSSHLLFFDNYTQACTPSTTGVDLTIGFLQV